MTTAKRCFLICEIGDYDSPQRRRADRIHTDLVVPACNVAGYSPLRADRTSSIDISEDIAYQLGHCPMAIADMGSPPWNANVMMEIGGRLMSGLPIILLADSSVLSGGQPLPFALRNLWVLTLRSPEAMSQEEQQVFTSDLVRIIKRREGEFRGIQSTQPVAIIEIDTDNPDQALFIQTSESAAQLFGEPQTLLGRPASEVIQRLQTFMGAKQWRAFADDQQRISAEFPSLLSYAKPVASVPLVASVPIVLNNHPIQEFNHRSFLPIVVDYERHSRWLSIRVIYHDVTIHSIQTPGRYFPSLSPMFPSGGAEPWSSEMNKFTSYRDAGLLEKSDNVVVYFSYSSSDRDQIRGISDALAKHGITVWFGESVLQPGFPFLDRVHDLARGVDAIAFFVGKSGISPRQREEIDLLLPELMRRGRRIVPVLLPDCDQEPEVPESLRPYTHVDFRKATPDPLRQLVWGITGKRPRAEEVTHE